MYRNFGLQMWILVYDQGKLHCYISWKIYRFFGWNGNIIRWFSTELLAKRWGCFILGHMVHSSYWWCIDGSKITSAVANAPHNDLRQCLFSTDYCECKGIAVHAVSSSLGDQIALGLMSSLEKVHSMSQ